MTRQPCLTGLTAQHKSAAIPDWLCCIAQLSNHIGCGVPHRMVLPPCLADCTTQCSSATILERRTMQQPFSLHRLWHLAAQICDRDRQDLVILNSPACAHAMQEDGVQGATAVADQEGVAERSGSMSPPMSPFSVTHVQVAADRTAATTDGRFSSLQRLSGSGSASTSQQVSCLYSCCLA